MFKIASWIPWPEEPPTAPQQPASQLMPPFLDDDLLDLRGDDPPAPDDPPPDLPQPVTSLEIMLLPVSSSKNSQPL